MSAIASIQYAGTAAAQGSGMTADVEIIAGQARARELTLVTANVGEFQRIEGLTVADWNQD